MDKKEKKFRNLPAVLTLLAGFITSIIAIACDFSLVKTLWMLIIIMVTFFIIGMVIRIVLDRVLVIPEQEENDTETDTDEENENKDEKENPDKVENETTE